MTLSSLQAQATRVILCGFSPSNCCEKSKGKPACQTCQLRVCLAKRSYTFEINDLAYSLIRSFPLEFLP